jgi:hypothetical protein
MADTADRHGQRPYTQSDLQFHLHGRSDALRQGACVFCHEVDQDRVGQRSARILCKARGLRSIEKTRRSRALPDQRPVHGAGPAVLPLFARNARAYCHIMATGMYVTVPEDLANCLFDDGFTPAGHKRGIETVLGDGANLVTVLVGSHEITRFVRHLWASARRRKPPPDSGTPEARGTSVGSGAKVIVERGGRRVMITLEQEGFGEAGPPEKVVQGMATLLQTLSEPDS